MKTWKHVVTITAIAVGAAVFAACGSTSEGGSSSSPNNTFVLSEFTIDPPTNTLRSGRVTLTADNVGAEVHEIVIVRADSVGTLPMKEDGSVDEAKIKVVGEIEDVAAGSAKSGTFDLTAGTYVALCNIVDAMSPSNSSMDDTHGSEGPGTGHVHFGEGMHATFTVT